MNLQAILREFHPHLEDDDSTEEEAELALLENEEEGLTPEDCEVPARPIHAGGYWKKWDGFRAAQQLYADEVFQVDSKSRDKTNKSTFGKRTGAIRKWYNELPKSKKDEAERVAEVWNSEGAPNDDKMQV